MGCEGLRLGLVITVLSSVLSQRDRDVSIVVAFVNWLGPIIEIPLKRKIAKMPKMEMEMAEREEYCYEHLTVSVLSNILGAIVDISLCCTLFPWVCLAFLLIAR